MMKEILSMLMLVLALTTNAQIRLKGRITNAANGQNLEAVLVTMPEIKRGALTDSTGCFTFSRLPKGNYLLHISYIGYFSESVPLALFSDTLLLIRLRPTATEINDVVVTGVSRATLLKESPLAIATVTKEKLQLTTSTNIIDAISKLPGIASLSTGSSISKPVIRGLDGSRVIMLFDGFRQEEQQWGDEHGAGIDEASVGRVEVLRGPGSLLYGSDAIAGVINFIPDNWVPEGELVVSGMINYQTNNKLISNSLHHAGNINGYSWYIRGSDKTAGNYRNRYDGAIWNSGFREWSLAGGFGFTKHWGYCNFSVSSFNQRLGLNEGLRDSSGVFLKDIPVSDSTTVVSPVSQKELNGYNLAVPYQIINHHRVSVQQKIFVGRSSLMLNATWQLNQRREYGEALLPATPQLYFSMHTGLLNIKFQLPEMRQWNTSLGQTVLYQQNSNKGEEFLIPEYQQLDYGTFVVTQKKFKNFLFEAGLRFDYRFYHSKPLYLNALAKPTITDDSLAATLFRVVNKNYFNLSGSLGFSFNPDNNWVLRINIAKGFRAPVAAELSSNGAHEGTMRYEYGNSALRPESNFQIDAGVDYTSKYVSLRLSVFENTVLNFIYTQKLNSVYGGDSMVNVKGELLTAYQFKQNNALLTGAEISLDIHPHPADWLHFENTFGYVYSQQLKQADSAKYLPFTPPAHYRAELRFDLPKTGKVIRHAFMGAHFDYYFHQNHILLQNHTETPTPDYSLVGFTTGADIYTSANKKVLTIIFSGENLLNTAYQSHLSRLKYLDINPANGRRGIWGMGINFSIKIVASIQFKLKGKNNAN